METGDNQNNMDKNYRRRAAVRSSAIFAGIAGLFVLVFCVSLFHWHTAERNRDIAAAERSAMMGLIESLTYDLPAALSNLPGTYEPISGMLIENFAQINEILEVSADADTVAREKAANLEKLAGLYAILGDFSNAVDCSRQAVMLYGTLYEATGAKDVLADYTSSLNNLAARLGEQGDYAEADTILEIAIGLQKQIAADSPGHMADLGRYYHNIAANSIDRGDLWQAAKQAEESLSIIESLFKNGEPLLESEIIAICRTLGSCYDLLGEYGEADAALQKALSIALEQIEISNTRANRRTLAEAFSSLASNFSLWDKPEESLRYHLLAISHYKVLSEDADNDDDLRDLAFAHMNFGVLLSNSRVYKDAQNQYVSALIIFGRLAEDGDPLAQAQYAAVYYALADNALHGSAYRDARDWYDKSLALYEPVAEALENTDLADFLAKRGYYKILFSSDYPAALIDSSRAMKLAPDSLIVRTTHAYALMYNDEYDEFATNIKWLTAQGENVKQNIRKDLDILRAMGHEHPYMTRIETLLK